MSGNSVISGNFTFQSATDLALLLRSGALPAPLTIIEERTVGPDLGEDSIKAGSYFFSHRIFVSYNLHVIQVQKIRNYCGSCINY